MTDDMDVADVLDAAADYIRVHGHCKDVFGGPDGYGGLWPSCVVGAIRLQEIYPNTFTNEAVATVECSLGLSPFQMDLAEWNDAPERTADEVITALMEAAARVRLGDITL